MTADSRTADLAQAGAIRLALFLPQYTKDAATGAVHGLGPGVVMLDIARALADRLNAKLLIVEQPTPRAALDCIKAGGCEFAFLGIEPSRAAEIDFTPAVFQFDYSFLVPAASSLRHFADVDRAGIRIAVVRNHASTMALTRMVKHAELVGFDLPDDTFAALRDGKPKPSRRRAKSWSNIPRDCRALACSTKATASIAWVSRWRSTAPACAPTSRTLSTSRRLRG